MGLDLYKDSIKPSIKSVYMLSDAAQKTAVIPAGKFDLVVEAFDRDDYSKRNFGLAAISYNVSDESGNIIKSVAKCSFEPFTSELGLSDENKIEPLHDLLDLGDAKGQLSEEGWLDLKTDAANVDRTFRYVLTHLSKNEEGRCTVIPDEDGFLQVSEDVSKLTLSITLWDFHGNTLIHSQNIWR